MALLCASTALLGAIPERAAAQSVPDVDPVDLSTLATGAEHRHPAVAFDGTSHLVVWEESQRIWGARLDASGAVVQRRFELTPSAPATVQTTPAVAAASSGGFLVVWAEAPSAGAEWDIRGASVDASGTVLDLAGFDVSIVSPLGEAGRAPGSQEHPAVAALGGEFLVVWEDGRVDAAAPAIYGSGVDPAGNVLDPDGIAISPVSTAAQRRPAIASNGLEHLVVWEDTSAGAADILGARVSATGFIFPGPSISSATSDQVEPAVASDGAGWLVVWNDQRSGVWQLTAVRVSGSTVVPPVIVIADVAASAPHAVASGGSGYLVAYEGSESALGARVSADGTVGLEFTIDTAGVQPPGQALAYERLGRHLAVHRESVSGVPQLAAALVTTFERLDVARSGTGTGSVTSSGSEIDCGAVCSVELETGSEVVLTAAADPGSTFQGWSGCPATFGSSCAVTMTAPAAVTATFGLSLPDAPGVPTYTNVGTATVTVSWSAAAGATEHRLERAPAVGGAPGSFTQVFAGPATFYDDAGLTHGTTYWYRVRGTNAAGAGPYASSEVTTALPPPPAAPAAPTYADVTASSVRVSWNPVSGATSYDLESGPSESGPWTPVATVTATSHVDDTVAANTPSWYRVRASNDGGDSAFSTPSSVVTLAGAPGAPTFEAITATSLTARWTEPVGGATSYSLERGSSSTGPWTTVASEIVGLTAIDAGPLASGTIYWYRVLSATSAGAGTPSSASQVITVPGPPGTPTFSGITTTSMIVGWGTAQGAVSYALERAPDDGAGAPGSWTELATGLAAPPYTSAGLTANTKHWYRVRATNASGTGDYSAAAAGVTMPEAPGTPSFASVTATGLSVSWTAPASGATSYDLERAASAGGPWTSLATATTALTHADSGLSAGTTYWYQVRAANSAGLRGAPSSASIATLPAPPAAPTYTSVGATSVTVGWSAVASATSYDLERSADGGATWATAAPDVGTTTYLDASLSSNTTYAYRVRATNASGDGGYSGVSSVTTLPGTPSAPTFSAITTSSATLDWLPPEGGATTYAVERAPDDGAGAPGTFAQLASAVTGTTYVSAGLAANTRYWYRVRATNASGNGAYSAGASVVTLANAPGTPTFTAVTATSLSIAWTAPTGGAASYQVERGPSAGGPWAIVATGAALSYSDPGLTPGTSYSYRVRATNADGSSGAYSGTASRSTLPDPPAAPTFPVIGATSVTVSWSSVTGATSYKLERAPDSGGAPGTWTQVQAGITGTSFNNTGLASNATYWYRVRATNASGDGAYSPTATVLTLPAAPGAPTFSSVTTTSLIVSWAAPAGGATSYDVDRGTSATGPWTAVATGVAALSAPDASLAVGTRYWYRVRAFNTIGAGAYSTAAEVITLPGAPGTPTFTNIAATSVTVSWTAAAGAATYKLERAPDSGGAPGTFAQIAGGIAGTSRVDAAGLVANTTYWYRVRATNGSGDGAFSAPASVVTLPTPPGGPTFSSITTTSLTVSWTAPANGAASYELERGTSATGPWTPLAAGTTALTFADSGLSPGTTYWYRVRATNSTGLTSAYATASVPTLPVAPSVPTYSSITLASVTVSWGAVTGATGYQLERALDDGAGAPGTWAQVYSGAPASFANIQLTPNTRYWYRVRATNASGAGAFSDPSSVMTLPDAPTRPTFTSITDTTLTVNWTAPAGGAATYEVQRGTSSIGPWATIATGVTGLSQDDSGLTAGRNYWYRVRAVNADGGAGSWSLVGSVTTAPAAPGAPTYTGVTTSTLTVNWEAMSGATTYHVERAPDAGGQPGTFEPVAVGLTDTYYNDVVAPNTTYWYRVRGANSGGYGAYSPASSVSTWTGSAGTPTFTQITSTGVTVNWTAPAGGATAYVVERAAAASGPWTGIASGVTGLTYADSGLAPATTYWYRITASNAAGATAPPSNIGAVTTLPGAPSAAPGAPTFGAVGTSSVVVGWTEAAGATSYRLERAADVGGAPGPWTQIATPVVRSYTDDGLVANTTYWYRVRGSTAGGDGPYSTASSVVTLPAAPGAPAFSSIGTTTVAVSWTAPVGGAASYKLERAASATGPWTQRASGIPGSSFVDSGLTANTTYHYRVRATNVAGRDGAYSPSASVTTVGDGATPPPTAPGTPSFASVTATAVVLSWSSSIGATGYAVERAPDAGGTPGAWTQVGTTTSLGYADGGRSANTRHWYRIRATNAGGGAESAPNDVITAPNAPGAPTFSAVQMTGLTVSWAVPMGGAATYQLERAPSSAGPWTPLATALAAATYADAGLAAGTTYLYRVRATNADGLYGLYSAARSVATLPDSTAPAPGIPGAPTFASVAASSLTVSWGPATGATTYKLERSTASGGAWVQIAAIAATSFTDAGKTANTSYWYRVRASNGAVDSAYSPVSAVTTAPNAPGAPTFTAAGASQVTLSWLAPFGGAATYKVERATSAWGPWTQVAAAVAGLTYVDGGLASNATYHYRVRGTSSGGTDGSASPARSVTTLPDASAAAPSAPDAPTYSTIMSTYLKVSWTSVADATSYGLERATASGGPFTLVSATTATSFTDTGRTANTAYWYRVRASNAGGAGAYSPESSVITAPNAPGAPTFSSVTATSITMSWTAPVGGASSYVVERASGAYGSWVRIAAGLADPGYVDSGLTGYTTYYYRVRGTTAAGIEGVPSATASVTTAPDGSIALPGQPGEPTFSSIASTYLRASWTAAVGATSYRLERAGAVDGPWTQVATVTTTSFTDTGRSANTRYWYRVRASNAAGDGPASDARSVTTLPNAPGAPTFSSVSATAVAVSWAAPAGGAASYILERATSSETWTPIGSGIAGLDFADAGLAPETVYYYRVRGTNADGASGVYSATGSVTTPAATVLATP